MRTEIKIGDLVQVYSGVTGKCLAVENGAAYVVFDNGSADWFDIRN